MGPVKAIDPQRMRHNFSSHATEYDLYAAVQKRVVHHLTVQLQGFDLPAGILLDIGTGTGALAAREATRKACDTVAPRRPRGGP